LGAAPAAGRLRPPGPPPRPPGTGRRAAFAVYNGVVSRQSIAALFVAVAAVTLTARQAPPAGQAKPDPQMPPITFRSEVNYVEIDAAVTDANGNFVRNLNRSDFVVLENGKVQSVSAFALVDLPVERFEQPAFLGTRIVEPDVRSNAKPPDGRLYVLLLDDLHVDVTRSAKVRKIARQFVDRYMAANDLAAVIHTSGRLNASQDFTSNKRLLDEAIDKFMGRKLRSATLNKIDNSLNSVMSSITGSAAATAVDDEEAHRAYNARAMLSTISSVADYLSAIHGRRKAIVLLSEGLDYDVDQMMQTSNTEVSRAANPNGTLLHSDTVESIGAATRANVNVYALDPRGLADANDDSMSVEALIPGDPNEFTLGMSSLRDEIRVSQSSLYSIADATGGFAVTNTNDTRAQLKRIVDENSSYYVLGYNPTNDKRDGRYRKVEVRLARPGLTVHARKGYVAPSGKPAAVSARKADESNTSSAAVRDALNSPMQMSGLTVSVFAAPFKGPSPNATVAVVTEFSGRQLTFTEKDGRFNCGVDMAYILVDPQGKVVNGNKETLNMSFKPDTHAMVLDRGFRLQSKIDVPPGRYALRLAVHESGGKVGSVFVDLVVPDVHKERLVMSGLALTSQAAGQVPTAGGSDLRDLLPAPPTTAREFTSRDQLTVLAEVYDNIGAVGHAVDITTTLRSDGGETVFSNGETRRSSELTGSRGGYGYTSKVPLAGLAPGLYVLKVEARASLGDPRSIAREVAIRIVP